MLMQGKSLTHAVKFRPSSLAGQFARCNGREFETSAMSTVRKSIRPQKDTSGIAAQAWFEPAWIGLLLQNVVSKSESSLKSLSQRASGHCHVPREGIVMSATRQKIDIPCPQCQAKLAVPIAALGKSGKCPHCGTIFPLALPPPAPPSGAATSSPLAPLSSPGDDLGLTPLGDADLLPLPDGGLAPLPAAGGLAPLAASNPFAQTLPAGDYTLQPAAAAPYVATTTLPTNTALASDYLARANASYEESKSRKYYSNSPGDGDGWGINAGLGGGAIMMLIALV